MQRYLLVRDSDGAILDELDAHSILKMIEGSGPDDSWLRGLSVVKIADHPGAFFGTTSITAMCSAEFAPPPRRRTT